MIHHKFLLISLTLTVCLPTPELLAQRANSERSLYQSEELPTAEEVIDRYVQLIGGFEILQSVASSHCHMSVISLDEIGLTFQYEAFRKNGMYFESYLGNDGRTLERGFKDGVGWERTNGDLRRLVGNELSANLRFSRNLTEAAEWSEDCKKIECKSRKTIDGREAYHLRFEYNDNSTSDKYFDEESGLLIRTIDDTVYKSSPLKVVCQILEYEQVGERLILKKQRMTFGNKTYDYVAEFCDFDVKIPDATFDLPNAIRIADFKEKKQPARRK